MHTLSTAIVIWGTQLLKPERHSALLYAPDAPVFMIESRAACRSFPFHKQKLAFVLSSMRSYADELRYHGRTVHYIRCDDTDANWFASLALLCQRYKIDRFIVMRQNDRTPQQKLEAWVSKNNLHLEITPNSMFLTPQSIFKEWADDHKVQQMETFYRWQRKRLGIMMHDGKPEGGRWNFDHDNRKSLPKDVIIPKIATLRRTKHRTDVEKLIDTHFADHPGSYDVNWLPTTRDQAQKWFDTFTNQRLNYFGDYEDAMKEGEPFLFHSAISALLNVGLLHPEDVVRQVEKSDAPIAAREGFIRQIIGWREFMFGLYHYKAADWKNSNSLRHRGQLDEWWWKLDGKQAPEQPLKDVVSRLHTYGYSHHIERLMVLGNYMLLKRYDPSDVYRWFMSMYVDAYEWVMVPNVIGMSQYADGGLDKGGFATKPYISGSNYLQKMGRWWPSAAAAKESEWTDLYWDFLAHHEDTLRSNYRLAPLLNNLPHKRISS